MRFQCQPGCIRCCNQRGEVYVTRDDIARLAAYLRLSRAEFRRRYICGEPPLLRFRKQRHKECPFLLADGCSVHPAKPLQCSSFPFWPEILESAAGHLQAAAYCPGLNCGPLVSLKLAQEVSGQVKEAFPVLYDSQEP
jgi:uncharacterized protein